LQYKGKQESKGTQEEGKKICSSETEKIEIKEPSGCSRQKLPVPKQNIRDGGKKIKENRIKP
jgi:hypothetical protein